MSKQPYQLQQMLLSPKEKNASFKTNRNKRCGDPWQERFKELMQFEMKHRHCLIPYTYPQNQGLARWVKKQRYEYKQLLKQREEYQTKGTSNIASSMTMERIQLLSAIGFVWDSHQATWEKMLNELIDFKKQYGHCDVPARYPPNTALGAWVAHQRVMKQQAERSKQSPPAMTLKRIQMLDAIGFIWDSYQATWEKMFRELVAFKQEFGHCEVPSRYSANPALATWVARQRGQYKAYRKNEPNGMSPQRVALLEAQGFKWEVRPKIV